MRYSRQGMTMPAPRILASTLDDLSAIADYHLRVVGPNSAEAVTDRILDSIRLLGSTPYLGPLHQDPVLQSMGYRKLICGRYICVYRLVDDVPTVYRIFHGSQNYPSALDAN